MSEQQVKQWVRDELRRILDMGLMYTDTSKNAPQAKQEEKKEYFNAERLNWIEQPPTDKGVWEKTEISTNPVFAEIAGALEAAGKPLFSKEPAALYWILKDRETGKVTGVGRRKK